ncbi:MAG: PorP/SprF family type IX secretion system membrane protein [Culturomica sp.]|jgi:type IX secretion system PorP/SprF family membrane protein|nr:PorP/SprF family type IX secretion system membrane protein [Culturomica sp.]
MYSGKATEILKRTVYTLWFLLVGLTVSAQDYNFSQFWENRTYYNPAFVGIREGELNTHLDYRRLFPKLDGDFSTIKFSMDMKTYNNYGFGFNFISSDEGGGFIKANQVGLSYSWRGTLVEERGSWFQLGVKASFNNESLNTDKFIFSSQLDPIYGNIFSRPDLEGMKKKQNYLDFSAGAVFALPFRLYRENMMQNYIGIAFHHFTRPKNNFLEDDVKVPMRFTLQWHGGFETELYSLDRKSRFQVRPGILFENQGEKMFSASSFNNFSIGADIVSSPVMAGIWYSSQLLNKSDQNYSSMIFKLGIKFDSDKKHLQYRITYSYDMSLGNLVKTTEGSHEIGLTVVYRFNARYNYNIFSF